MRLNEWTPRRLLVRYCVACVTYSSLMRSWYLKRFHVDGKVTKFWTRKAAQRLASQLNGESRG